MPDIGLRLNKDMLVLSAPIDTTLARQGVDVDRDRELLSLIEPEAVHAAYRLEMITGAQCLVTNTTKITKARLTHVNMDDRAGEIAAAALAVTRSLKPQHILAEIGSTGLPLDASSAFSLKQNRDQYAEAACAFGEEGFDAYFLNGMTHAADMQCALMGIRKQSDKLVFASVTLDAQGRLKGSIPDIAEAAAMMAEYGADVVGFESAAPLCQVLETAQKLRQAVHVPLLVQLAVGKNNPKQQRETAENPYFCPDTMIGAATQLRAAGVQFLRASGNATASYTGALVAASDGFDVVLH